MIIGDSAAFTQRDFWNGITPSCLSGKLAARHIAGREEYSRDKVHPYLFRISAKDSRIQRALRDRLFRSALPALHRFMARRAGSHAPMDEAASASEPESSTLSAP
jgi:flavin-dependent dehydrogenase